MVEDPDREINDIIEDKIDRELETDTAAVFSKKEVMNRIRDKVRTLTPHRKQDALERYQSDNIDRRAFLKILGFGIGGAAIGTTGAGYFLRQPVFDAHGDTTPTGHAAAIGSEQRINELQSTYSNVVNLNTDAGLGAGSDVSGILQQQTSNNTLLVIEEGNYQLNSNVTINGGKNIGIVGKGEVNFVLPKGSGSNITAHRTLIKASGENNLYENINWDWDGDKVDPQMVVKSAGGKLELRDFIIKGDQRLAESPGWHRGRFTYGCILLASGPGGGHVFVDHYKATPGSYQGAYGGSTALLMCCNDPGTLTLRDCHLEDFGSSGVYASRIGGELHVEGGFYRNNSTASIRINSDGSYIDGAYFEVDMSKSNSPNADMHGASVGRSGLKNLPPIKIEGNTGVAPYGKPTIRNVHVRVSDANGLPSSIVPGAIWADSGHPGFTVKDTCVEMDIQGPAAIKSNSGSIKASGVTVIGKKSGPGIIAAKSGSSSAKNCCISRPGQKTNISGADFSQAGCDCGEFPSADDTETWSYDGSTYDTIGGTSQSTGENTMC